MQGDRDTTTADRPAAVTCAWDIATTSELVQAFAWLIDHRRFDQVRDIVCDDVVYANPAGEVAGWPALRAGVEALALYDRTSHLIANHVGHWDGNDFHGSTYCIASHLYRDAEGRSRKYDMGIEYREHIVRRRRRLRLRRRFVDVVWQTDVPVASEGPAFFREAIAALMRPADQEEKS